MRRLWLACVMAICVVASCVISEAEKDWKRFVSTKHNYIVEYPGTWYLFVTDLKPSLDYLDIVNFSPEKRVEGVVLADGGAEIRVGDAPAGIESIEEWIARDEELEIQIGRREIKEFDRHPTGCLEIIEVISRSEVGPERMMDHATYYCKTTAGVYAVALDYWMGEPKGKDLRDTALRVTLSLRVAKQ